LFAADRDHYFRERSQQKAGKGDNLSMKIDNMFNSDGNLLKAAVARRSVCRFLTRGQRAMINLDDVDRQLIGLLRDNARTPVVALAKTLRVARATVQNRLTRLENEGVIVGYTVRLKRAAEKHRIRALMSVAVQGNCAADIIKALRGHPNVTTIHSTNGRWDLIAELQADSLEEFDRVLGAIRLIDGIANTETSILLSTHKA
jgi:DNA-binding Lrp family transcriptional regulator